jgi:DNA-binding NarL/FixJ family response regulator
MKKQEMDIKVVLIEDNDTIRNGMSLLLEATEGMECLASFGNAEDYLKKLPELEPDIILMDIGLPGMNGIEAVKKTLEVKPGANIIMLTVYEDTDNIFKALCEGATGYLLKKTPPAQIIEAIKDSMAGGAPMSLSIARKVVSFFNKKKPSDKNAEANLTDREKAVLQCLIKGNSYQMTADELFISINTVRFHLSNIYKKLHIHTQTEAVAIAIKRGLV